MDTTKSRNLQKEAVKYDKRVQVFWDVNGMASGDVLDDWLKLFDSQTRDGENPRLLQLDHWTCQETPDFQLQLKSRNIKGVYVPENCTELGALTDVGPGKMIKGDMKSSFKKDYDNRTEDWADDKIPLSEIRVLLTKWLGDAWTRFCAEKTVYITERFKSVGFFNDLQGRENHLIKVPKIKDYSPPKKEDPRPALPSKKRL